MLYFRIAFLCYAEIKYNYYTEIKLQVQKAFHYLIEGGIGFDFQLPKAFGRHGAIFEWRIIRVCPRRPKIIFEKF